MGAVVMMRDVLHTTTRKGYTSDQYSSLGKIDEAGNTTAPPLREARQRLEKFLVIITVAWPACLIRLSSS